MKRIILWGHFPWDVSGLSVRRVNPRGAQQTTAAITGTVVDEGGAAINSATITVTDTDRGLIYTAKTNDSGTYNFVRVPIGNYQVKAEAPGFQSAVQSGLTLVLNQTARLDFKMRVGRGDHYGTGHIGSAATAIGDDAGQHADRLQNSHRHSAGDTQLCRVDIAGAGQRASGHFDRSTTATTPPTAAARSSTETASSPTTSSWTEWTTTRRRTTCWRFTPAPDAIQEFNLITNNALGGVRQLHGRHRQRVHQVRHESVPWRRMGVLPQRHAQCQPVGEQAEPEQRTGASPRSAGICSAAHLAVRSSRTSCSSSWTTRDSASTILQAATSLLFSRTPSAVATSHI